MGIDGKIRIGISSCLLGERVRYDGGHKKDSWINGTLSDYVEFVPVCPEVGIGLGVPRPTIRLVNVEGETRVRGVKDASVDVTEALHEYARDAVPKLGDITGYILKKDSPSCGMERVKRYTEKGMPEKNGIGAYAETLMQLLPNLPVEEEGRLGDPMLRENFIERLFCYRRWQQLEEEGVTVHRLTTFHAQHKYNFMAHNQQACRELGKIAAAARDNNVEEVAEQYIALAMRTLKRRATRKNHLNVLQHLQGYLKRDLDRDDKAELGDVFGRYHKGEVPLIVPITLLKHHFRKCPDPYIENSYYLSPYPAELRLRNGI